MSFLSSLTVFPPYYLIALFVIRRLPGTGSVPLLLFFSFPLIAPIPLPFGAAGGILSVLAVRAGRRCRRFVAAAREGIEMPAGRALDAVDHRYAVPARRMFNVLVRQLRRLVHGFLAHGFLPSCVLMVSGI
jgi:hypothetical protein